MAKNYLVAAKIGNVTKIFAFATKSAASSFISAAKKMGGAVKFATAKRG